jgi:predicted RNA binding protein YcfA (HicA-like mRNA interferase family)
MAPDEAISKRGSSTGVKGSHVQLKHPSRKGRVTVPHPRKDLPIGTVKSIERQSGLRILPTK